MTSYRSIMSKDTYWEKVSSATIESYWEKDWEWKKYKDIIETPSLNFKKSWEIQYNQDVIHPMSCFIHWPLTALSALTGRRFTEEERLELVEWAWKTNWADPQWWGYFNEAIKYITKWYNAKYATDSTRISYYKIPKWEFKEAHKKNYLVVTWYMIEQWQRDDRNDDWTYNNSKGEYWKDYWWHCICSEPDIVDNYFWKRINIIKNETLKLFTNWYIFVIKQNVRNWYELSDVKDKIAKLEDRKEVAEQKARKAYRDYENKQT